MTSAAPLLIVVGSLVVLALVEHLLTRPRRQADPTLERKPEPAKPKGLVSLSPQLSVTGLDERGVEQLRSLIATGEVAQLASFLAFNQPEIPELKTYIKQIQNLVFSNNYGLLPDLEPRLLGKIVRATRLPGSPAGFQLSRLDDEDLAHVLVFDLERPRLINRDFMARFGGHEFYRHFARYTAHKKGTILQIPATSEVRPSFDVLAISGLALKGRDIEMGLRLRMLTLSQLNRMADDLNLDRHFRTKTQAVQTLAEMPGSRALFAMQYVLDDLFCLQDIEESPLDIQREWGYLTACAKLLVSGNQAPAVKNS